MMLIRVPLQSVAAVAAAVPPSPSHRMFAYIDADGVDKTSSSAAAAATSQIKVSHRDDDDDDDDDDQSISQSIEIF